MQTRNKAQASTSFTPGSGGGGGATAVASNNNNNGASSGVDASRRAKPSGVMTGGPSIAGNAADDRYLNTRKRFLLA